MAGSRQSSNSSSTQQYSQLENQLILLAKLNSLLGYKSNRAMLEDCKFLAEGFDQDGRSFIYHHLIARGNQVEVSSVKLEEYDNNIRNHLEKINYGRTEKITLRYFQYLAALYTEIILDQLFNAENQPLEELKDFVGERKLNKLAYWMATGSGKTLLLHLNYYQFLHYNCNQLDNILLITPNEGLSEQHLRELAASGIPARRFYLNNGDLWSGNRNTVQVIEITKLVEGKKGGGVRVPVEAFEGKNVIFVDEGHKGTGGEAWRNYREAVGKGGFTFEYSATFGQALSAADNKKDNKNLIDEYKTAIIFDYSYKYFYSDGFGKDFRIVNLKNETDPEDTCKLLMGNLLSFYEQVRVYQEHGNELKEYNVEKPLWAFVGSTVISTESESPSDVQTVVEFFHRFLKDRQWAVQTIGDLLSKNSGLITPAGDDVFSDYFSFLCKLNESPEKIYSDILERIFHTPCGGGLHINAIKNSSGELGLKAAHGRDYFGVIYIGDTNKFKQKNAADIPWGEEVIADSLFSRINNTASPIYVLIGAKKFMEGWNSWRVSSMGLLNIGKNEGAQIIQLFGRGVRLKGKDMSLKRSAAFESPEYLQLLETLNVFAVRANYMQAFRECLNREGVDPDYKEFRLPVKLNLPEKETLVIPRPGNKREFTKEKCIVMSIDKDITVHLNLLPKVEIVEGALGSSGSKEKTTNKGDRIPDESLKLVDWQEIYLQVLVHKERKKLSNLVIRPQVLHKIVTQCELTVQANPNVLNPKNFAQRNLLQRAITQLLCSYVDRFYQKHKEKWEEKTMEYRVLDENDPNLSFNRSETCPAEPAYIVRVPSSQRNIISGIKALMSNIANFYQDGNQPLPRLFFDQHLYVPLVIKEKINAGLTLIPPGLEESEEQFVRDLRQYCQENEKSLDGKTIYLLRNLSRGRGVGFFEGRGFYPDFILWVLDQKTKAQRIIFIEPHGMLHAKAYAHDEKARLWERLPQLAKEIAERSGRNDVSLDAFIISATPYSKLRQHYEDGKWDRKTFAKNHILFRGENDPKHDYVEDILFPKERKITS